MQDSEVVSLIYSELLKVAGGAAVVLAGLSVFLSKIWAERIARREGEERDKRITELKAQLDQQAVVLKLRMDAALQKTVHVSKLQFEHEYQIYKLAWEQLFSLRQATLSLRPVMDRFDLNESKEDRMRARMQAFTVPYNAFLDVIEKNKPFYPAAIYNALSEVREKCRHELIDYEYDERPKSEYYKEAMKNHEELLGLIEATCAAIRDRVTEVSTQ
ncbi:MAG: hypothetical protein I8H88_10025 [Burkholderiales bacterium]|nr:hypothetical protein [Burkholderiales bacterium]